MLLCLLGVAAIAWTCNSAQVTHRRVKRIMSGSSVEDHHSPYSAFRYYVWIGFSHAPAPRNLLCGGSLLTVDIVQTACHCVAGFEGFIEGHSSLPIMRNPWENSLHVYAVHNFVADFSGGVMARAYFSHPKCLRFGSHPFPILYDYGLITLRKPLLPPDARFIPLNYSPVYTIKQLTSHWKTSISKESFCLYIGFGLYRFTEAGIVDPTTSPVIRHGWNLMANYLRCYQLSNLDEEYAALPFNYTEDSSWFCTLTTHEHPEHEMPGDSGGPVTCNDEYVGLVSQNRHLRELNGGLLSLTMSIAYTVFENSAEYRRSFVNAMDLNQYTNPMVNYTPTDSPILRVFARSPSYQLMPSFKSVFTWPILISILV